MNNKDRGGYRHPLGALQPQARPVTCKRQRGQEVFCGGLRGWLYEAVLVLTFTRDKPQAPIRNMSDPEGRPRGLVHKEGARPSAWHGRVPATAAESPPPDLASLLGSHLVPPSPPPITPPTRNYTTS